MLSRREGLFIVREAVAAAEKARIELDRACLLLDRFLDCNDSEELHNLVGPAAVMLADLWVLGRIAYEGQSGGIPLLSNVMTNLPTAIAAEEWPEQLADKYWGDEVVTVND